MSRTCRHPFFGEWSSADCSFTPLAGVPVPGHGSLRTVYAPNIPSMSLSWACCHRALACREVKSQNAHPEHTGIASDSLRLPRLVNGIEVPNHLSVREAHAIGNRPES